MNVFAVPAELDVQVVDRVLDVAGQTKTEQTLFDARHVRWIDPSGMIGLLVAGAVIKKRGGSARLQLPDNSDVVAYLKRMGFFREATGIFEILGRVTKRASGSSGVLLEVTPITANADVHAVIDDVQKRAGRILASRLGYPATSVVQFSVILSEVCQNIVEHAEGPGWVAAQAYNWTKRLGRYVVVLSVMDVGRGFRHSLNDEHAARYGDRWGDATALEAAFLHGLTRFPDSGRGQGIQQIRRQVQRWNGSITIRSGSARIAQVPEWDSAAPLVDGLEIFPGAQISIILPALT